MEIGTLRCKDDSLKEIEQISNAEIMTRKDRLRKRYGLSDAENPFFELDVDIYW